MKLAYMMTTPDAPPNQLCWNGDPVHIMQRVAEIGYDGIELQVRDPSAFDGKAIGKRAAESGLVICALSTGGIGAADNIFLVAKEPEIRRRAIDRFKSVLHLAHEYGIDASIGRFRGSTKSAPSREIAWAWLREALDELLPVAESLGVRIVLEPQARYIGDMLNMIGETVKFIKTFSSSSLKFEGDLHHQDFEEPSLVAALVEGYRSGLMSYVQLADSNRSAPGSGNFNWVDILATLHAVGYDGWLAMEFSQKPETSDRLAQQAYSVVKGTLTNLGI